MNPRIRRCIPMGVACIGALVALGSLAVSRTLDGTDDADSTSGSSRSWLRKYDPLQRIELFTYDWRARHAADRDASISPRLGLVTLDDTSIAQLQRGDILGVPVGPLWPRYVYGLALRELRSQGAEGVAMDILLGDERPDHGVVPFPTMTNITSDNFLVAELKESGNVVVASVTNFPPAYPFRRVAELGDVHAPRDVDGTSRRVHAFSDHQLLHPLIEAHARRQGLRLDRVQSDAIVFEAPSEGQPAVRWPIAPDGTVRILLSSGSVEAPSVFMTRRVWHMGIVLAAMRLGLDLDTAEVGPDRIVLKDAQGVALRTIPVNRNHQFFVNWTTTSTNNSRIPMAHLTTLIQEAVVRSAHPEHQGSSEWTNHLVVIGSVATGNNLADRGATPIAPLDYMVSTYINVTDSLLRGQFVHFPPAWLAYLIVLAAALLGSGLTWRLHTIPASLSLAAVGVLWVWVAFWSFDRYRLWLPLAHPILAGLALNHAAMLTYRNVFEQNERQRVRGIFAKIVSPNVVQELLGAERIRLGGARRELTVFFADVRGFTELTDKAQVAAEEHVRVAGLNGAEAEAYFEQQSSEVLQTVNLYLATIADVIKSHRGTLDKYIGDCVMAFWGAPTPNARHAVDAVCAAVEAQQAMERLNQERESENRRRAEENVRRAADGLLPLPELPRLALGTGINSGFMTVGLMGSDSHILNYTVFGREVNLAARLEGVSGRGRIIIGEATHRELSRHRPDLAARCQSLEPVSVKGFRQPVPVYEVPWRESPAVGAAPADAG
ncbi:MAG: adenylate/guanylate cyclase domain-containing protein [Verrucomicrobia bacterium]|nr:adenylate/guanylate cyclase domain-containing protein [Verrucomicrobiota bacterium]